MSGLELLVVLKADNAMKHIPVILQNADSRILEPESQAKLSEKILPKPYTKQQLLEAISKFI